MKKKQAYEVAAILFASWIEANAVEANMDQAAISGHLTESDRRLCEDAIVSHSLTLLTFEEAQREIVAAARKVRGRLFCERIMGWTPAQTRAVYPEFY